ncbi:MAG: GAF domain-containing protein, partial [Mycobacterium leprae]
MEGILQSIVAAGFRQMEGRGLSLYRWDSLSESFPDVWALQDGQIVRRYSSRAARGSLTARILRSGKLYMVEDAVGADGMSPFLNPDIRSFVAVPVLVHGTPWGVLYVNSPQPHNFTTDDVAYVQAMARQLGSFLEESSTGSSGSVELSTVRVLAATVDAKDHYTRHHSTN